MLFVVQGFIDSFFMLYLTYVSDIVIAGLCFFTMCPATIRSENMSGQAQRDLLQTESHDDEQARETRYRLNCRKEKNSHSLLERPKLRNAGVPKLLGLDARDAQVKPHLEQQNLGELITAEHKVLIETCDSGNNHRYAIVGQKLSA